jgi:hypothetical protein
MATAFRARAGGLRWLAAVCIAACGVHAGAQAAHVATWRAATTEELKSVIPERAPVATERVETEATSASGIVNSDGKFIAGAVLITAGYSANGKYSDYLVTQIPLKLEGMVLPPGGYLLGWKSGEDALMVTISEATTGKALLNVRAPRNAAIHRVEQIRIWPPQQQSMIQLGRFTFGYTLP